MPTDTNASATPADLLREAHRLALSLRGELEVGDSEFGGSDDVQREADRLLGLLEADIPAAIVGMDVAEFVRRVMAPAAGSSGGDRPADSLHALLETWDREASDLRAAADAMDRDDRACWDARDKAHEISSKADALRAALGGAVPQPSRLDRLALLEEHFRLSEEMPALEDADQYAGMWSVRDGDGPYEVASAALRKAQSGLAEVRTALLAAPLQEEEQPQNEGERRPGWRWACAACDAMHDTAAEARECCPIERHETVPAGGEGDTGHA